MQINATEAAGLFAFVPPALASGAAAFHVAGRGHRIEGTNWRVIAIIQTLFVVEILASLRHRLHNFVDAHLVAAGVYPERRPAQVVLLFILAVVAVLATIRIVYHAPTPVLALVRGITAIVIALFAVESISYYVIDGILWQSVGPILLIGWIWLACGWIATAAALSAIRR